MSGLHAHGGLGPSSSPLFVANGVHVRYGHVHALRDADFCLDHGERLALVGANGSGKSTLLRVLHGLIEPSAGRVETDPGVRQAMLFQRPHMLRASALTNVALGLRLQGVARAQAESQAARALKRVGLGEVANRNARTLSSGQQQRLALARAWALRPDVLLLDEPTSSLDPHAKRDVETLVAQFCALPGVSLVFSSHNLGQVKRLASRVMYMEQGAVLADLPVRDFFDGPLPEAARLFVKGELA